MAENGNGAGTTSGKSGTRNLEAENQKQSGECGRVCKTEDSRRHETEKCAWFHCSRDCLSCTVRSAGKQTGGGGGQPTTDYNRQVTGCEGHVIGS